MKEATIYFVGGSQDKFSLDDNIIETYKNRGTTPNNQITFVAKNTRTGQQEYFAMLHIVRIAISNIDAQSETVYGN